MQLTNIKAIKGNNGFYIPVEISKANFSIKLDTGASKTVISIEKFTGELTREQIEIVKNYVTKAPSRVFMSASGHLVVGYLVKAQNVYVGYQKFENFYYYLVVENLHENRQVALLGNDFLNCCSLEKAVNGDIIIPEFDISLYSVDGDILHMDEILELL